MPTESEIAWAAGFTDGEGNIGMCRSWRSGSPYVSYYPYLQVHQMDPRPLRKLRKIFGCGSVGRRRSDLCYYWRVNGTRAGEVTKAMLGWLIVKKEEVKLLVNACCAMRFRGVRGSPMSEWDRGIREWYYHEIRKRRRDAALQLRRD